MKHLVYFASGRITPMWEHCVACPCYGLGEKIKEIPFYDEHNINGQDHLFLSDHEVFIKMLMGVWMENSIVLNRNLL